MTDHRLRAATLADVPRLEVTLARAFADDPAFTYVVPEDTPDQRRLRGFFRLMLRLMTMKGRCLTQADGKGTALWIEPPGGLQFSLMDSLRILLPAVFLLGPASFRRFARLMRYVDSAHPDKPHAYLLCLGVDPDWQGKGLGGALLKERLPMLDAEGTPAYLETTKESNVALYRHFGFEVIAEMPVDTGSPERDFTIWFMWRDPAPA